MRSREDIIGDRSGECLHDAVILGIRIVPATTKRTSVRVEVEVEDMRQRLLRLAFVGAVNMGTGLDFDVLRDNAPWMVDSLTAVGDDAEIRSLIESQGRQLNVEYRDVDDQPYEQPDRHAKLLDPSEFVLFRLRLFGGTINIIARDFKITRPRVGHLTSASS